MTATFFDQPRFRYSGVYYILNRLTNRIYVGQTGSISIRLRDHVTHLTRQTHHNKALQLDWNTCGSHSFEFGVLAPTGDETYRSVKERNDNNRKIEKIFIHAYQSDDPRFGYNIYHTGKKAY